MRVYDRFLNLLTETDNFQSLQFTRKFHSIGGFEIHINKYMKGAEFFNKGNLISLGKPHKVGIIVTREIVLNEQGKATEIIKVTGTTLCGIIDKRITIPPKNKSHDRKSGNAETVIKHYVNVNFLNPVDPNRRLPNLEIAPSKNRGEHIDWESRYKKVSDEIEEISQLTNLGWEIRADFQNKKFIFDVIEPSDLTQGNPQGNQPVMFSPEFENVKGMQFIDSDNDLRNFGYVGGQGEGVERKVIELGDTHGWERIETFIDARDVGSTTDEKELTEQEVEHLLTKRGNKKMKEMQSLLSLEAEIITPITRTNYEYKSDGYLYPAQPKTRLKRKQQVITPFQYERDFDLGCTVDIVNKSWGLVLPTPIVEITEIHDQGGFSLDAVFGENRPTLTNKLNRKFKDIESVDKEEHVYSEIDYIEKKLSNEIKNVTYSSNKLWEGTVFPLDTHTVKPNKKITDCRNGWTLLWSHYADGEGAEDRRFFPVNIPKEIAEEFEGGSLSLIIPSILNRKSQKYIYLYKDKLVGHANNNAGDNGRAVLRGVYEW